MTVKLSELRAAHETDRIALRTARAAMNLCASAEELNLLHAMSPDVLRENLLAVVAHLDATDVLIEIAEAAAAYMRPVETEQDARDKEVARRSLHVALAKVSP